MSASECSRAPPSETSDTQQSRGSDPAPPRIFAMPRTAWRWLLRRSSGLALGLNFNILATHRPRTCHPHLVYSRAVEMRLVLRREFAATSMHHLSNALRRSHSQQPLGVSARDL